MYIKSLLGHLPIADLFSNKKKKIIIIIGNKSKT